MIAHCAHCGLLPPSTVPPPQIHTASLTAFSNWPTAGTPLGRVTDIDFAPAGGFVAVGNHRGRALLYQLRDYAGL
jgi:U3 small nucleolar RNA-associated protein 18